MRTSVPKSVEFGAWAKAEADARQLSLRDIAKHGCDPAGLSLLFRGKRAPTVDMCRVLSLAFTINFDDVLRRAGYVVQEYTPPPTDIQSLVDRFTNLTPENRRDVLDYMAMKMQQQQRQVTWVND